MSSTEELRKKVLEYALRLERRKKIIYMNKKDERKDLKDGEAKRCKCGDLPGIALEEAGAKNAYDFGTVTDTSNNRWGTPIDLAAAKPGDILQFHGHIATVSEWKSYELMGRNMSHYQWKTDEHIPYRRKHHSAIVYKSESEGKIWVLEQCVGVKKHVKISTVYVRKKTFAESVINESVIITRKYVKELRVKHNYNKEEAKALLAEFRDRKVSPRVRINRSITYVGNVYAYSPVAK